MPPRRRRQQHGLERVLGTPALFATAYGNVGSSIYYALGVTAVFALGLTPLVFVIAGLIFAATAATYAEGTVRYPEAGGSSSFARHAFDETVSFGAAWAQMLVYVATVAISAFFVPHYLSVFWEPLRENPWDIVGGIVVIVILVGDQHRRRPRGGDAERPPGRGRLRHAGAARDPRLRARVQPERAPGQRRAGRGADLGPVLHRDPDRDAGLHRGRDGLEPRRGGARPGARGPERLQARRGRRLRHLPDPAGRGALGPAGRAGRRGRLRDEAGPARRRRAASRTTPCSAWSTGSA